MVTRAEVSRSTCFLRYGLRPPLRKHVDRALESSINWFRSSHSEWTIKWKGAKITILTFPKYDDLEAFLRFEKVLHRLTEQDPRVREAALGELGVFGAAAAAWTQQIGICLKDSA